MNIIICDDIQNEALKLEDAIKQADFKADVRYFEKIHDILEYIKTDVKIDVCFLDIIMPEMNGIELAKEMRKVGFNSKIVFLTTSREYGVDSYQVKAYSYLLKPLNPQDVINLLNEIKESDSVKDTAGIKIDTRSISRFVYFYEISCVEVMNKNVSFRLLDGSEIVIYASLGEVLPQLLADGRFAQCHRSYVVNMDAITQIRGKEIFLRCGGKAPISRNYNDFKNHYFTHVFEGDK